MRREESDHRLVLVISNDVENQMEVITVIPITLRKVGRDIYPNEVLIRWSRSYYFMPSDTDDLQTTIEQKNFIFRSYFKAQGIKDPLSAVLVVLRT